MTPITNKTLTSINKRKSFNALFLAHKIKGIKKLFICRNKITLLHGIKNKTINQNISDLTSLGHEGVTALHNVWHFYCSPLHNSWWENT